ncbi:hypothetical protein M011DRAFT_390341, partial [Sporormia fimetaria CBS 119925]
SRVCQTAAWPFHKANCIRPNYILHIALCPGEITDPQITRTLSVPASTTFTTLHRALQIAFNWSGKHAYDFIVRDPEYVREGGMLAHIER